VSNQPPNDWRKTVKLAANILCGAWLIGGSLFFFFRFSMVFYAANKAAIDSVLDRVFPVQR